MVMCLYIIYFTSFIFTALCHLYIAILAINSNYHFYKNRKERNNYNRSSMCRERVLFNFTSF